MSQFVNLDQKESKKIHPAIYKDALRKKKDANLLAQNKSFSTANSILILSSEEAVKALMIFLHSEGFHIYKLEDSKKIFSDHKMRHNIAKLIEAIYGLADSFLEFEKIEKSNKSFSDDENINAIVNIVLDFKEAGKPFINSMDRTEILENFNDDKNKGLYTDYRKNLQVSSEIITEEKYIETLETVERIFRIYRIINVSFNPKASHHKKLIKNSFEKDMLLTMFNSGIVLLDLFKKGYFK